MIKRGLKLGNLNILEAVGKTNPENCYSLNIDYRNSLTMRSDNMLEELRSKQPCKSVEDAHRKALRLYRRMCRLVPFLIRNNKLTYKTTPALAKQQLATHFRALVRQTDLKILDLAISEGYEQMLTMEHVYVEPCGTWDELAPKEKHRDTGYSFFHERFAKKEKPASGFLTSFYKLQKDPNS